METVEKRPKRRWVRYSLLSLLALVVIAVGGFVRWGLTPLGPSDEALAALRNMETVTVSHSNNAWVFTPVKTTPTTGYIFYPGGHVDPRSYAIYARETAEQGYLVVVPEMPLSLAVFGIGRAHDVIALHPTISKWFIGGHSLGGSMAAVFAANNGNAVSGLVLLASYPASSTNLSATNLRVTSVYGNEDTVVNRTALESSKKLLPSDTKFITLEGGNHAQFGSYGLQPGDTANPTMSADEQQALATAATVTILKSN